MGQLRLPLRDKRVGLSKLFVSIALVVSVVGLSISDLSFMERVTILLMFLFLAVSNFLGFYILKNDRPALLIFVLFCVYVWVAFPFKLVLAINDPMTTWLSYSFFEPGTVQRELPDAFISVFPGLVGLFAGFYFFHRMKWKDREPGTLVPNHTGFIVVIAGLMALRVFNQMVLNIGLPGVRPDVITIPFVTGILELLSRPVLLALVNLYFYYALRSGTRNIWIALLLLTINIILGLRVGYKSELVLQGLLLVYYLLEQASVMARGKRKLVLLFTALLLISTVMIYPLVNTYRSYLLQGKEFSAAIDSAQQRSEKGKNSFALAFLNRVNGIDAFYAATKLGAGKEFGLASLFDDSVMDLIKQKLYGNAKDEAVTAFGTTQFSVLYLAGGGALLTLGCFVIGWIIRWSSRWIREKVFRSPVTFQAYLPLFCILWIKLLSSGGVMELYIKELILVVACLAVMERVFTRNRVHPQALELQVPAFGSVAKNLLTKP